MYPSVRDEILVPTFPTIKEGLEALGFDAVELHFIRDNTVMALDSSAEADRFKLDTPESIDNFRKHLERHRVRVSGLLMHNNFGSSDIEGEIAWAITAVRAASALGIPAIRIDAVMQGEREFSLERNVSVFADAMLRVLDATSADSVEMGIENHGFQGNDPEFLDKVLGRVDSPRVGLTIDTGNFYWRGHPLSRVYEIIEHFAPYCKHTHAKNIAYPPDVREVEREIGWEYGIYVCPLPDGDIDHRIVVKILKAGGYSGDLCLEDESLGKWAPEQRQAILIRDADFFHDILK